MQTSNFFIIVNLYTSLKRQGEKLESIPSVVDVTEVVEHVIFDGSDSPHCAPLDLDSSTSLKFDFHLDIFQSESIKAINTGNSVLVIASTSAGKSVVAYHAISRCQDHGSVAIYTAPVKSLANQKYIELRRKFDSVSLITGDVNAGDENSKCVVMTAEVLRNRIVEGSSMIHQVQYVILDEAHYLGDPQRGTVWEQIIMGSPENVRFVLLTATLPNYSELADWIFQTRGVTVHCVVQKKRPVPLRIHAMTDKTAPVLIKNGEEPLDTKKLSELCSEVDDAGNVIQNSALPRDPPYYVVSNHVNSLVSKGTLPLLLFCLSRRKCMQIANLLDGVDDSDALDLFDSVIQEKDALILQSKQYEEMRNLVTRGIGVHHSGILPLLRETIEILFSSGKLVVLVATETFALGVNAPARAVVFSSIVKWGGTHFRTVTCSEFMQMAGRAGRRGYDEYGDVFVYVPEKCDPSIIGSVIGATPDRLESRLRVTSTLVISCRSLGIDPHAFVKKSFMCYLNKKKLPRLQEMLRSAGDGPDEKIHKFAKLLKQIVNVAVSQHFVKDVLKPGRLLYIVNRTVVWGWCSLLAYEPPNISVLVSAKRSDTLEMVPCRNVSEAFLARVQFPLTAICAISEIVMKNPTTVYGASRPASLLGPIERLMARYQCVPLFHFDKKKLSAGMMKLVTEFELLEKGIPAKDKANILSLCAEAEERVQLETEIHDIENPPYDHLVDQYLKILTEMGYIDSDGLLQLKGRVALSLHIEEPLPIVELILSGFFLQLSPSEISTVASAFVESPPKVKRQTTPLLASLWTKVKKALAPLDAKAKELGLPKFPVPKQRLMAFTYTFMEKKSVSEAANAAGGLNEGIAVRILKRTRELLAQFETAASLLSVEALVVKFKEAYEAMVDGCNFDSSLYKVE